VSSADPAAEPNAVVEDDTSRPSTRSTVRPAAVASSASRRSSVVLPTPPGPCRKSVTNALGQPASADPNSARSAVRPTKPRSRTACSRSASTPRPGVGFGTSAPEVLDDTATVVLRTGCATMSSSLPGLPTITSGGRTPCPPWSTAGAPAATVLAEMPAALIDTVLVTTVDPAPDGRSRLGSARSIRSCRARRSGPGSMPSSRSSRPRTLRYTSSASA